MSFVEGIKAIPADIAAVPTREGKLKRAAEIGQILVDEVTGVLKAIPYGIRALRQHKKLPDALARSDDGTHVREVSIARNVRYADSPRAVMDVYLPRGVSLADEFALDAEGRVVDAVATTMGSVETTGGEKRNRLDEDARALRDGAENAPTSHPIALFIHGGVWAVGEKWQFAPMAHRLAEEGVVTCVATYSLFPQALAPRMWEEVSDALTFTMDNAARLCPGASAERVVLMGHSAGAHLCAMALMHRRGAAPRAEANEETDASSSPRRRVDRRQPRAFVGLCGVYDIDTHYAYEDSRGVALVSTMARAMGGRQGFDRASPLRLVRADPDSVAVRFAEAPSLAPRGEDRRRARRDVSASGDETASASAGGVETDVMRRTDWAPMGIMDTDENISVGEIVAQARAARARPATATKDFSKTRRAFAATETGDEATRESSRVDESAIGGVGDSGTAERGREDAGRTETETETARLAAFATRRRAPPPGPPAGAFAGDEAARQAGYVQPGLTAPSPSAPGARLAPGCFPPAYLLAGCADITVPWFESAEFHLALTDAGARSRMLLYLKEPHGSFVLKWHPRGAERASGGARRDDTARLDAMRGGADAMSAFDWNDGLGDGDGLTPYARDIVRVIKRA